MNNAMENPVARDTSATADSIAETNYPTPIVVGIGASSGGLNALKAFLGTVPENTGLAYVIVVHLSPEHDSQLAELLQTSTAMPVQQVSGEMLLKANHIYIIPPGKNIETIDSHVRLAPLEPLRRDRAPIDHFFRMLSRTHDGNAVGIILTGAGSDGTLGIQEIKGQGGLTVVQQPTEAEYDSMPQSAISTGVIDLVLPVREMIDRIMQFLHTQPQLAVIDDEEADVRPDLQKILAMVRARVGNDFSRYKQSTIMRRIRRRMQLARLEHLEEYVALLQANNEEVTALANDFLINVTRFFRDTHVFDYLENTVIPGLFSFGQDCIRVWSVGCATGEEAYSLAILMMEYARKIESKAQIQIFASDTHALSLKKAREGLYPGDIETDVSSERLDRFFHYENGVYRIRAEVREMVIFSPHNLLTDPPFSRIDLILCRNVLIYLQRSLQPDVITLFHYALKPQGILVLGTAESVNQSDLFITESKTNGIYLKRNIPCPEVNLLSLPWRQPSSIDTTHSRQPSETLSYGALHHRMVERYAQPSILVNTENKVVHISHNAGRYLNHPGGIPTTALFKLVNEAMQPELQTALHFAREQNGSCVSRPVQLMLDGALRDVTMHVRHAPEEDGNAFTLIIFDERDSVNAKQSASSEERGAPLELEIELELTKRRLQASVDEYEASQEEMRASNEELQSANEELRSTLEELETSKEELQSINEELQKRPTRKTV